MRHFIYLLVLTLLCLGHPKHKAIADETKPEQKSLEQKAKEDLEGAQRRFEEGNIDDAKKSVKSLEQSLDKLSPQLQTQIMLLIVRVAYAFDDAQKGERWLDKIHDLNSDISLDPVVYPPEAIKYWKGLTPTPISQAQEQPPTSSPSNETDDLRKRAKFWIGIFPFGIGHYDADQYERGMMYASLASLSLYSSPYLRGHEEFSPPFSETRNLKELPDTVSTTTFLGTWGYEIVDLMPLLLARDAQRANWVRWSLSFFPLGVAQHKNGENLKAASIGATQLALLGFALATPQRVQQTTALKIFSLVYAYSIYDGWVEHRDIRPGLLQVKSEKSISFWPSLGLDDAQHNIAMNLRLRF